MKRLTLFALLILFLSSLSAQEVKDFSVKKINKRYQIEYYETLSYNADPFLFARKKGSKDWFKCKSLLGKYKNVESFSSQRFLEWDPVFDYRKDADYQFKLYMVNPEHYPPDTSYESVEQIGLLYTFGFDSNYQYHIMGGSLSRYSDMLALPVGVHEIKVMQNKKWFQTRTINISAFQYHEIDLSIQYAKLKLSANDPNVQYMLNGSTLPPQKEYRVLEGKHKLRAVLTQPDSSYPQIFQEIDINIDAHDTIKRHFDLHYGTLSLEANVINARYLINDQEYSKVADMKLPPGEIEISALCKLPGVAMDEKLSKTIVIKALENTTHKFIFDIDGESAYSSIVEEDTRHGSLEVRSKMPIDHIVLDGKKYPPNSRIVLKPGTYAVSATLKNGESYDTVPVKIKDNEITIHDFSKVTSRKKGKFADLLFSEISVMSMFYPANKYPDPQDPSSFENPNTAEFDIQMAYVIHGFLGIGNYSKTNQNLLYSKFGIFDRVYILNDLRSQKTDYAFDILALEGGWVRYLYQDKLSLNFNLRAGANVLVRPIFEELTLDNVNYKCVRDIYVTKDGEHDYSVFNLSFSAQATAGLDFKLFSSSRVALLGGVMYSPQYDSMWYNADELELWKNNSTAPEPQRKYDIRFPKRNGYFDGLGAFLGFEIDFSGW